MGRVAVDLVGDGAAHRQVEGVRRQQRVVCVGERLVVGELHDQPVARQERRRERSAAHGVALEALGSGFSTAYLVSGAAAAVAAALTAFGMIGLRGSGTTEDEGSGVLPSSSDGRTPDPVSAG